MIFRKCLCCMMLCCLPTSNLYSCEVGGVFNDIQTVALETYANNRNKIQTILHSKFRDTDYESFNLLLNNTIESWKSLRCVCGDGEIKNLLYLDEDVLFGMRELLKKCSSDYECFKKLALEWI